MYYDPYRKKHRYSGNRQRGRNSADRGGCLFQFIGFFLKLFLAVILILALFLVTIYVLPFNVLGSDKTDLFANQSLPSNRTNILLLGVDELNDGSQRSDSMIIASFGNDSIKLVSVMRDTIVDIPGYGEHKLNSAYAYGGPELTVKCINQTFGMNITRYIVVDYIGLVKIIDAIGGIDIEMSEQEMIQTNRNVGYSAHVFKPLGYTAEPLEWSDPDGDEKNSFHLDGLFSLGYARIRKIDTDYMRAFRQRKIITAIKARVKSNLFDIGMYGKLLNVWRTCVKTNLSLPEFISLAERALMSGEIVNKERTPGNSFIYDDGKSITLIDPQGNANALYASLYE